VPLRRPIAKEAFVDESQLGWLYFDMYDDEEQVFCRVNSDALKIMAQSQSSPNETPRATFERCRERIEQIASDNYDKGEKSPWVKSHELIP
jgi:hypothetical protein